MTLQASRRFYEEVLGLEVIQHAPIAMTIRHGSNHTYVTYVVVHTKHPKEMTILNHNGLDVGSEEEVRTAYELLCSVEQEFSATPNALETSPRPQQAAAACRSGSQQGMVRQCATWTCHSGWVTLGIQGFLDTRASEPLV